MPMACVVLRCSRMETTGKFITIEGIEGSGKSTQQQLLAARLRERGRRCVLTKEPGGTLIGRDIRGILLNPNHGAMTPVCEALLYLADRAQHHVEVVSPQLAAGFWVISDRYHDSTLAYQGAARGLSREHLDRLFHLATQNLKPDLTILLDLEPTTGLLRAQQRNHHEQVTHTEGRFEAERLHFHQAVRRAYLALAAAEPDRFRIVPAEGDATEIAERVFQEVRERWKETLV